MNEHMHGKSTRGGTKSWTFFFEKNDYLGQQESTNLTLLLCTKWRIKIENEANFRWCLQNTQICSRILFIAHIVINNYL